MARGLGRGGIRRIGGIAVTTLNVVLDEMLSDTPSGISLYTAELARALIDYAPSGCFVEGIVASSPESDYVEIGDRLPELHGLFKSALAHRDLRAAWQHGFTPVPSGMIHAPSLFAPLRNHDRVNTRGSQIAVTMHNVTAWSHPELLASRQVSWTKAMANRAVKYADAVVVPTHAIAAQLSEYLPLGERVRVIGAAVRSSLALPADAAERAEKLELPEQYLLALATGNSRSALAPLFVALASAKTTLPLLLVGDDASAQTLVSDAGLDRNRFRMLGTLSDENLAVTLDRATLFLHPSVVDGFGMPMLEAFKFGTPVIHSDAPALIEVAGDAGYAVVSGDAEAYPARLAEAIDLVLDDDSLRETLGILGADRAKLFTWRAAAEGVWQLHADL
jgi:glycosyltransferase involved in cell wall biosynthesis